MVVLLLLVATGCGTMGHEVNDDPHITPTSKTGVTSDRGKNVYEIIPEASTPPAATTR